jgi:uncharacterized 2Fe-2S/4Fe-4S cluster protein (DUF4445 family)
MPVAENALLRIIPGIAGFIGGDTVAGIIATGMHDSYRIRILIDIGTNGEIVLGNKDRMSAASAAAGPAFEGGRIECGMRAERGAINHVRIDGNIQFTTIGGEPARGICGSGLIEAVAEMLRVGIIDQSGKFIQNAYGSSTRRFIVTSPEYGDIFIKTKDISEVQLAVGAVRAAIEILLARSGLSIDKVDEVFVAGAFGFHLRPEDLITIGLLPDMVIDRIRFVGNKSLEGALMALLSYDQYDSLSQLASTVDYIELAGNPQFQDLFISHMHFPE